MSNPLEQFVIKPIIPLKAGDVDISFTNSSLFMLLAVAAAALLFSLCLRRRTIVPGLAQSLPECAYGFIANLMKENIGPEGLKYFSFIFSIFCLSLSATFWDCFLMPLPLLRMQRRWARCRSRRCCLTLRSASANGNGGICARLCPKAFRWRWRR